MHALYIPSLCFLPISKHNPSLWSPYLTPTIICQLFLKGLASCHIERRKIRSRSGKSDQNNRKKNGEKSSGHSWIELSSEKRRRRSSWRFVQINLFQRFAQLAKMLSSSSFTHSRPLIHLFSVFSIKLKESTDKIWPTTGFEPRTSGISSDCSTI